MSALAAGVVLTAGDGAGHTGASNAFDVVSGPLHHFTWSTVSSPKYKDVPFRATVTAQDSLGYTVTSYAGTATLSGRQGSSGPVTIGTGMGTLAFRCIPAITTAGRKSSTCKANSARRRRSRAWP